LHRLSRPITRSVLGEDRFANAPRIIVPIFSLQDVYLQKHGQRCRVTIGVTGSDLLIHRQCFIRFTHRIQIRRHRHFRRGQKLIFRVFRDERFERFVRFSEFLFAPLRFGEQDVRIGGGGRVGITINYLFVLLRSVRARQRRRSGCRVPIGIKAITGECNRREQENDRGRDDRLSETLPKETGFECDIARWRWRYGHKRRGLSVENRVSVVLCHAKLSRASRAKSESRRDKLFSSDKILLMNAFWNSFETLLGLGVMWRNHTSMHDLDEDVRLNAQIDDLSNIRLARVERSGDISFIKK